MHNQNEEYTTCSCGRALPEGELLCPPCEWAWSIQQADFGTVLAEIQNAAGKYALDIAPDGGWLKVSMLLREPAQKRVTRILDARRAKYQSGKDPWWVLFWLKSGDHGSLEFAEV
jgi:hypothetical protein